MPRSPPETSSGNRSGSAPMVTFRLLNGDVSQKRDFVKGFTTIEDGFIAQILAKNIDCFMEEHWNDRNQIFYVRLWNINNTSPNVPFHLYKEVSTLHVSCVSSIKWLFSHLSAMPKLNTITFGAACFVDEAQPSNPEFVRSLKMEKCPSVTKLIIRVDHERYNDGIDQHAVNLRIGDILESAKVCFPELKDLEFQLPLAVEHLLTEFRVPFAKVETQVALNLNKANGALTYKALFNHHPPNNPPPHSSRRTNGHQSKAKKPRMEEPDVVTITDSDEESSPSPQGETAVSTLPPPTGPVLSVPPKPKTTFTVTVTSAGLGEIPPPANPSLRGEAESSESRPPPTLAPQDPRLLRGGGATRGIPTQTPHSGRTVGPRTRFHPPQNIPINSQTPTNPPTPTRMLKIPTSRPIRPPIIIPAPLIPNLYNDIRPRHQHPQTQIGNNPPLPGGQGNTNCPRPQGPLSRNGICPPTEMTTHGPRLQGQLTTNALPPQPLATPINPLPPSGNNQGPPPNPNGRRDVKRPPPGTSPSILEK